MNYLYNANGQICAVETTYDSMTVMYGYIYDADGDRVAKGTITSFTSCDPTVNGFVATANYVRDQSGNQLSEFATDSDGNTALVHTNVYAAGTLMATYDAVNLHFYLKDWLGTRRVQTDYSGVVEQNCASLPYGDAETCTPLPTENLYTGKERDAETAGGISPFGVNQGNDYFGARYYSSVMGRWLTPDYGAGPVPYASFTNPQSLNLYAYVGNNPVTLADPNGHQCEFNYQDTHCGAESLQSDFGASLRGSFYSQFSTMFSQFGGSDPEQQESGSSGGTDFWSGLGHHLGNLLHGHSWSYGTRFVVTSRILSPSESEAVTDVAQGVKVAAAVGAGPKVGAIGTLMSIASNPSPQNIGMNLLPWAFPELRLPMAFGGAAWDASKFTANHVIVPVFTPDALQSDTIDDGLGHTLQAPQAAFDADGGLSY